MAMNIHKKILYCILAFLLAFNLSLFPFAKAKKAEAALPLVAVPVLACAAVAAVSGIYLTQANSEKVLADIPDLNSFLDDFIKSGERFLSLSAVSSFVPAIYNSMLSNGLVSPKPMNKSFDLMSYDEQWAYYPNSDWYLSGHRIRLMYAYYLVDQDDIIGGSSYDDGYYCWIARSGNTDFFAYSGKSAFMWPYEVGDVIHITNAYIHSSNTLVIASDYKLVKLASTNPPVWTSNSVYLEIDSIDAVNPFIKSAYEYSYGLTDTDIPSGLTDPIDLPVENNFIDDVPLEISDAVLSMDSSRLSSIANTSSAVLDLEKVSSISASSTYSDLVSNAADVPATGNDILSWLSNTLWNILQQILNAVLSIPQAIADLLSYLTGILNSILSTITGIVDLTGYLIWGFPNWSFDDTIFSIQGFFETLFPFCLIPDFANLILSSRETTYSLLESGDLEWNLHIPLNEFNVAGFDDLDIDFTTIMEIGAYTRTPLAILYIGCLFAMTRRMFLER